jgi:hypothetical protein
VHSTSSRRRGRSHTPPHWPKETEQIDVEQTTVDKARLVKQDDFVTRQMFEAKDEIIESLKTEATKLLKEKDDSINALEAEVCNP